MALLSSNFYELYMDLSRRRKILLEDLMPPLSIGQSKCAVKQGPVWPNDLDSRTLSEGSTLLKILRDIYLFVKNIL